MTPAAAPPRVRIFRRDGSPIRDVFCRADRSWVFNKAGACEFHIATSQFSNQDDLADLFYPFNRVLVEREGIHDWAGFLTGDSEWTGIGTVRVSARTPEYLTFYENPRNWSPYGGFSLTGDVSEYEIRNYLRSFSFGDFGYSTTSLYEELVDIFDESQDDWIGTHFLDDRGRLRFAVEFYDQSRASSPKLGKRVNRVLEQAQHFELQTGVALVTEGPIYNSVTVWGDGPDWENRPFQTREYKRSVELYGRREYAMKLPYTTPKKLNRVADDFIRKHAAPRLRVPVSLVDSDLFEEIFLGDYVTINLPELGFGPDRTKGLRGDAIVKALAHDEEHGTMPMIVETRIIDWYEA